MAQPDVERYLNDITSQHKTQPRYMTHLRRILEKIDGSTNIMKDIPGLFYLHTATGDQLDKIAQFIGMDRRFPPVAIPGYDPLLSDDDFRMVLLGKVIMNHWNGTNETFQEIWDSTLGEWLDAEYTDNQDMSITARITGTVEPILEELILAGFIIPKPDGVRLNLEVTQPFIADGQSFGGRLWIDSATISMHHPYFVDPQTIAVIAGASVPYNEASICIPVNQDERQATDTFMFGAAFPNNDARFTVVIQ